VHQTRATAVCVTAGSLSKVWTDRKLGQFFQIQNSISIVDKNHPTGSYLQAGQRNE